MEFLVVAMGIFLALFRVRSCAQTKNLEVLEELEAFRALKAQLF